MKMRLVILAVLMVLLGCKVDVPKSGTNATNITISRPSGPTTTPNPNPTPTPGPNCNGAKAPVISADDISIQAGGENNLFVYDASAAVTGGTAPYFYMWDFEGDNVLDGAGGSRTTLPSFPFMNDQYSSESRVSRYSILVGQRDQVSLTVADSCNKSATVVLDPNSLRQPIRLAAKLTDGVAGTPQSPQLPDYLFIQGKVSGESFGNMSPWANADVIASRKFGVTALAPVGPEFQCAANVNKVMLIQGYLQHRPQQKKHGLNLTFSIAGFPTPTQGQGGSQNLNVNANDAAYITDEDKDSHYQQNYAMDLTQPCEVNVIRKRIRGPVGACVPNSGISGDGLRTVVIDEYYDGTYACRKLSTQVQAPKSVKIDDGAFNCFLGTKIEREYCFIPAVCGNGVREQGEACDLGNRNGQVDSGCNADCTPGAVVCGNGTRGPGEQCDLGSDNGKPNSGCDATCHSVAVCGNGVREGSEQCDGGPHCDSSCHGIAYCGDGHVDPGEQCDGGAHCNSSCQSVAYCGDGNIDAGEQCDSGNPNGNATCDRNCKGIVCGNGIVQPGEQCDGGPHCDSSCHATAYCGDGHIDAGEQCDGGPHCDSSCHATAYCGDGHTDPGEQCDSGNVNGNSTCDRNCKNIVCGNGIIQPGEQCDGGPHCDSSCHTMAYCGDGHTDPGEQCDGGAHCSGSCQILPYCGDGHIDAGEQCDGGPHCNSVTCQLIPYCGDGIPQTDRGEQCDHGATNGTANDLCDSTCHWIDI